MRRAAAVPGNLSCSGDLRPSNEFPGLGGYSSFVGDYSGLAVGSDGVAYPVWSDTRNPVYTFDDLTGELVFAGYGADTYSASIDLEG